MIRETIMRVLIALCIGLLGAVAAAVGVYGTYEQVRLMDGGGLLLVGGCVVAIFVAIIPPIAEYTWHRGDKVKAVLWWLAFIPAGVFVGLASAERFHDAKAPQAAERSAAHTAVARAASELKTAQEALPEAVKGEVTALAMKTCGPVCRGLKATATAARQRVANAETALVKAERAAVANSAFAPPAWLMQAALEGVAFIAIWTALSGHRRAPLPAPVKPAAKTQAKRKGKRRGSKKRAQIIPPGNDNLIPLRAV